MRPKTKLQKKIFVINSRVKNIRRYDEKLDEFSIKNKHLSNYVYETLLPHIGLLNKGGRIICIDCGGDFKSDFKQNWQQVVAQPKTKCPHCNREIDIISSQKRSHKFQTSFKILTVVSGYQLERHFEVYAYYNYERDRRINIYECYRIYTHANGEEHIFAKGLKNNYYGRAYFGDMSLKDPSYIWRHNAHSEAVYPRMKILPEYKRNGFKGNFHNLTPYDTFKLIYKEPIAETLIKAGQFELFSDCVYHSRLNKIKEHWKSIKIAIRNKYIIPKEKGSDYLDMLGFLDQEGKDMSSPKYVCPKDIHKEHQKLLNRINRKREKQKKLKKEQLIRKSNRQYINLRKRFFDLNLTKGKLEIKVIKSVSDLKELGILFKHCIYQSNYHEKKNSLLLCAFYDGNPVETIEYYLQQKTISQSRGLRNKPSEHNKEIIELINENKKAIELAEKGVKKRKKRKTIKQAA